jgi:hypothetical protein
MATTRYVSPATDLRDALSVGKVKSSAMRCRKKLRDALSVRSKPFTLDSDLAELTTLRD